MAKRRITARSLYGGLNPDAMMRAHADSIARNALDYCPKMKAVRDEISAEVQKATKRALKKHGLSGK